jgi:hypothetical protein
MRRLCAAEDTAVHGPKASFNRRLKDFRQVSKVSKNWNVNINTRLMKSFPFLREDS